MNSPTGSVIFFVSVIVLTLLMLVGVVFISSDAGPADAADRQVAMAGAGAATDTSNGPENADETTSQNKDKADEQPATQEKTADQPASQKSSDSSEAGSSGKSDSSGDSGGSGGSDSSGDGGGGFTPVPEDTEPAEPEMKDGVQVFQLTGNDQMQYNLRKLKAEAGKPIRIVFENVGKLPKQAMGHNVVVLVPGVKLAKFAQKAQATPPDYKVPDTEEVQSKIIANTKILGPGEKASVEFTIEEPGKHRYVCTFPAHYVNMNGILLVE